jgi:pimeloyl-ACP methyl ester carboxylesterase
MTLHFKKTGDGYPLIILHGLFGMSDNWYSLGKVFGAHFSTYMVDQRNHGRSPHAEAFDYDVLAADLLDFMEEHFIESAHILGHSMGGKTAMTFAVKFPHKVGKLVVADIAPRYYPPHHQEILAALHAIPVESIASRKEAEEAVTARIENPGVVQFLLKNLYPAEEGGYAWRFNLSAITRNIESVGEGLDEMYRFDKPALFVRGEKSDYIRDADIHSLERIFPKATVVTLPDAGHWVHAEQPALFAETVLGFLKK